MKYEEIIKNLEQIRVLCEEDSPLIASKRIEWLINDLREYQKKINIFVLSPIEMK